jgi:hypothetical protein
MPVPNFPPIDTDVSDPPNRGQAQAVFSPKMDAMLAALQPLADEQNALAAWMQTTANSAEGWANDADSSATAAASSATASANSAAESAASAEEAETNSLAYVGWYSERHQGSHASAPSTRNGGAALVAGDLYYNSTDGQTYIWS